jgi:hypothetical protein
MFNKKYIIENLKIVFDIVGYLLETIGPHIIFYLKKSFTFFSQFGTVQYTSKNILVSIYYYYYYYLEMYILCTGKFTSAYKLLEKKIEK